MSTANLTSAHIKATTAGRLHPMGSIFRQFETPRLATSGVLSHVANTRTTRSALFEACVADRLDTSAPLLRGQFVDELDESTVAAIDRSINRSVGWFATSSARPVIVLPDREFPTPLWLPEVVDKMTELLSLPANWDSYGADPIRADCINYALNTVLATCMQATTPAPAVVPLNTGGVLLEWHCRKMDLEVRIDEPEHLNMACIDAQDGTDVELDLDANLTPLLFALSKLSQRG